MKHFQCPRTTWTGNFPRPIIADLPSCIDATPRFREFNNKSLGLVWMIAMGESSLDLPPLVKPPVPPITPTADPNAEMV